MLSVTKRTSKSVTRNQVSQSRLPATSQHEGKGTGRFGALDGPEISNICLEFGMVSDLLGVGEDIVVGSKEEIKEDLKQRWFLVLPRVSVTTLGMRTGIVEVKTHSPELGKIVILFVAASTLPLAAIVVDAVSRAVFGVVAPAGVATNEGAAEDSQLVMAMVKSGRPVFRHVDRVGVLESPIRLLASRHGELCKGGAEQGT